MNDNQDAVEYAVGAVIDAVQQGDRGLISQALEGVGQLDVGDVLAELSLLIDELMNDLEGRVRDAKLPPNGLSVIEAAQAGDLDALTRAIGSDDVQKTLTTMFVIVAALKDAQERS